MKSQSMEFLLSEKASFIQNLGKQHMREDITQNQQFGAYFGQFFLEELDVTVKH